LGIIFVKTTFEHLHLRKRNQYCTFLYVDKNKTVYCSMHWQCGQLKTSWSTEYQLPMSTWPYWLLPISTRLSWTTESQSFNSEFNGYLNINMWVAFLKGFSVLLQVFCGLLDTNLKTPMQYQQRFLEQSSLWCQTLQTLYKYIKNYDHKMN
jgi:hypothetical protein